LAQLDSYVDAADLEQLYASLAERLDRIVRLDVRAPDPVIEDACQFAWSRLAGHVGHVRRDSVLPWLARTAIREAIRLVRREGRELSLELAAVQEPRLLLVTREPGADELVEQRERLDSIRSLPERQQRMLWLAGIGLSYADIALSTGSTERTVERQLLRARRTIRALAA
jgi:RNA polymerase sigma factor (sigma-70 family)